MDGGIIQDDEGEPLRMGHPPNKPIDQVDDGAAVDALLQQVQVVGVVAAEKPDDREALAFVGGQPPSLAARLPAVRHARAGLHAGLIEVEHRQGLMVPLFSLQSGQRPAGAGKRDRVASVCQRAPRPLPDEAFFFKARLSVCTLTTLPRAARNRSRTCCNGRGCSQSCALNHCRSAAANRGGRPVRGPSYKPRRPRASQASNHTETVSRSTPKTATSCVIRSPWLESKTPSARCRIRGVGPSRWAIRKVNTSTSLSALMNFMAISHPQLPKISPA